MSIVSDLTPTNLTEEKQKFFDKNCKYNPQFKYKTLATLNKIYKYGKPKPEYLELAKILLEKSLAQKSFEELNKLEGPKIDLAQGKRMTLEFLKKNKLEEEIEIQIIKDHVSKTSNYKNIIKFRDPFIFRKQDFLATLYHEIGTHALRRLNYTKQPFYLKKSKHNFKGYLRTEEGLASLQSRIIQNYKITYFQALNYLAVDLSQQSDFITVFNFMDKYLKNKEKSWWMTVKFKRGIYDTSEEGGFTKSIVYLEGMVKVWQYLQKSDFDLPALYWGKIDVEDVDLAKQLNPDYIPHLPSFYLDNLNEYQEKITEVARLNKLDQIKS